METAYLTWNETKSAAAKIREGAIVVFPTETVYGIGCLPNQACAEKLAQAKGRPDGKPFTLMCATLTQVAQYCEIDCGIVAAAQAFMPGEVTFLLKARKGIDPSIDLGTGVVGVRVPNSDEVRAMIEEVGSPLLVSSANLSGEKPAASFDEAKSYFSNRVDAIVEGVCVSSVPSTIVDFAKGAPKLIREGSVPFEIIKDVYLYASESVSLGCDHGGLAYKNAIAEHLSQRGFKVLDCGCDTPASVDYPVHGKAAAKKVVSGEASLGVVVCTSGEGIAMAVNKVPGARCGIGYDDVAAGKTREHNNANLIAFGQKYMDLEDVLRRVDIFLIEKFSPEEKHHRRVRLLEE